MKTNDKIWKLIQHEREHQDLSWGTIQYHPHDVGAWLTIMRCKLRDAEVAWMSKPASDYHTKREIMKLLAVGVACLEQHGAVYAHEST